MKVAHVSCLSAVALQNRLAIVSLYYKIAAAFAGIGARVVIPEGTCQVSDIRVVSGIKV